jgi:hypothetical protein
MTAASSYQAIPDASAAADDAMENGGGGIDELAPLTRNNNDDSTSTSEGAPRPMIMLSSSASALMSKFGYIALGLVIGYSSSESGRRALWNPTVKINITEPEEDSPWTVKRHNHQDDADYDDEEGMSLLHHGKSFSHALPFEDAFPGMKVWEETLPSFLTEESKLLSSSSPFSSFLMGASSTASGTATSSGSSSSNNKHLLYLVHPTAVTLLYDTSRSSNYFVSEYSLDYFLLNSGGFDAQINQAYCGVVSKLDCCLALLNYTNQPTDSYIFLQFIMYTLGNCFSTT